MFEITRYPEWKQLAAKIKPLLATKQQFLYEELQELSGIDVRTDRGRGQFYKFRKFALKEWLVWFECEPHLGYSVIPAGKQPEAAAKRVRQARRKISLARNINGLADGAKMTPAERVLQAQTAVLLNNLSHVFNKAGRQFAAAASSLQLGVTEDAVKRIADPGVPKAS